MGKMHLRAVLGILLVLLATGLRQSHPVTAQSDELPEEWPVYLAWNEADDLIAVGYTDGQIKIWDAQTGQLVRIIAAHTDAVTTLAWSPDGTRLASGGYDNLVKIWEASSGTEILTLTNHQADVYSVCWNPDGSRLVSVDVYGDPNLFVLDVLSGQVVSTAATHGTVSEIRWSPDGNKIALGLLVGAIEIWDVSNLPFQPLVYFGETSSEPQNGAIGNVNWSSDGNLVAGGASDGRIRVWEISTGTLRLDVFGNEADGVNWRQNGIRALHFSADNQVLTAVSGNGTIRAWSVASGHVVQNRYLSKPIYATAFSHDGTRIAFTTSVTDPPQTVMVSASSDSAPLR